MKQFKLTSRTLLGLALMGALTAAPTLTPRAHAQDNPEIPSRFADANDLFENNDNNDRNSNDRDNDGRNRGDRVGRGSGERRNRGDRAERGSGDRAGRGFGDRNRAGLDDRSFEEHNGQKRDFGGRNTKGRAFGGRKDGDRAFGDRKDSDRNLTGRNLAARNLTGRSERAGGNRPGRDLAGRNRSGRLDNIAPIVAPKFVGVVTKVKNDREFDVRIADKTYNVYLSAPSTPVSVGQTVNLDGERIGNNDIRSASLLQPRRR